MEADMNNVKSIISTWLLATIFLVACCAAPGCKSNNGSSELLERELRCQEDRIYQLEDELDEACYALESSRRENESLKKELTGGDKGAGGRFAPSGSGGPPKISTPAIPDVEIPDLDGLPIETPADEAPRFLPKSNGSSGLDEAPPFKAGSLKSLFGNGGDESKFSPATLREKPLTGDASRVTKLVINRQLTGGWNADGHHGDEGVFVAFEPRDANNKLVEATGDVSIVVLDPSQSGAAARVARWDYVADEAEMHFRSGPIGRGFQFELPWPSDPPKNRDLRLFVRFSKTNGEQVETDAKIRITPCDNWTSKEPEPPAEEVAAEEAEAEIAEPEPRSKPQVRTAELPDRRSETPEPRQPASRLKTTPRPWAPMR